MAHASTTNDMKEYQNCFKILNVLLDNIQCYLKTHQYSLIHSVTKLQSIQPKLISISFLLFYIFIWPFIFMILWKNISFDDAMIEISKGQKLRNYK